MPTISALGIGSGLDLNGLLGELESAERAKLTPITASKRSYEVKLSAYGRLDSVLSSFQSAAEKLSDRGLFESVKTTATGTAAVASADSGTVPGSYDVNVTQLSQTYSVATQGLVDKALDLGAGIINFAFASGSSLEVSVDAETSSLEDIRDAINDANGGVVASIVNDGSGTPYRLAIRSTESGTEAAISSIDFGDLSSSLVVDNATEVTATNALLSINGIDIQSQSNQLEDVVEGLTLTLKEVGESVVSVTADESKIEEAITDFVSSYNKLQETIDRLGGYDQKTGVAGDLIGDSALRGIESRLKNVLVNGVPESDLQTLSAMGISLQLDGKLEVDEVMLGELIKNERLDIADFFTTRGEGEGLAIRLSTSLDQILEDSGLLESRTKGLEGSIERLDERYADIEAGIGRTVNRYRLQFGRLDSLVAEMNSTSGYIAQQFDILNAQKKY